MTQPGLRDFEVDYKAEKDTTILAIDDEESNLKILETYLNDAGYKTILAESGIEALNILEAQHDDINVILLDRMMPNMDGMEFIRKIRNHPSLPNIPVIMQTAVAEREAIIEGIHAGVYYYLTKPFEEDMLISVVQAAARDYELHQGLREKVQKQKLMLGMVTQSTFEYRTLEEAKDLSAFVANFFSDPEKIVLGLSELMINAIEHGNLSIGYDGKTELINEGRWEEEVKLLQMKEENAAKVVKMDFKKGNKEIVISIEDEGNGFDWEQYMDISIKRASDNHGRGIALANHVSFDKIEFLGTGNLVRATVDL